MPTEPERERRRRGSLPDGMTHEDFQNIVEFFAMLDRWARRAEAVEVSVR
jgi:hypothetical protein